MSDWSLPALLIAWLVATGVVFAVYRLLRLPTSGLVFAYIASLALIHWTGAMLYALPWYGGPQSEQVYSGFRQATYGLLSLVVGVVACLAVTRPSKTRRPKPPETTSTLPWAYVVIGITSYLVLIPLLGSVPTLSAVLVAAWNLFAIGIALQCRRASEQRRWTALVSWLAVVFLTPALTIVTQGFLGFGVQVLIVVIVFLATTTTRRWRWMIASLLLVYPALSFYVAYMAQRDVLRQSVWGGDPMTRRIVRLYDTVRSVEPFDITNAAHLQPIDGRLNQNQLVGACVEYLDNRAHPYADGETLWYGIVALVPRIMWAEKPVVAGSMGLVSKYTGLTFGAGTSVGIGQVMEFYMNFGTPGVVIGFLLFGIVVAAFDRAAGSRLQAGDVAGFAARFLPGMALLQAGGSMVEITSSIAAGAVTAYIVNTHVLPALGVPTGGHPARRRQPYRTPAAVAFPGPKRGALR